MSQQLTPVDDAGQLLWQSVSAVHDDGHFAALASGFEPVVGSVPVLLSLFFPASVGFTVASPFPASAGIGAPSPPAAAPPQPTADTATTNAPAARSKLANFTNTCIPYRAANAKGDGVSRLQRDDEE